MQNYTKYEKCLDTPTKLLYYYSNTKKKDLRMENLRFLNICLSAFFWQMDNDTIKDLGLCPICQKGHIMKGSLGYSCNYFKNMNDKCTFNIYHSYWGK